jgi:dienelactone hydrolase
MKQLLALAGLLAAATSVMAAIRTETIEYREGDTVLEGLAVYDDALAGRRPGVLVVHQWKGLGDYERMRAEMLARLGYVAFCADIYGKGVRADNPQDASALAGRYKADRALLRARARAALAALQAHPRVDAARTAALGYCFGGTTVLELARDGAGTLGVVSFHGGLGTDRPAAAGAVPARVLVLHGADDPFVPPAEVQGFEREMRAAGADWQLVSYGGAVHSFTDRGAGTEPAKGAAYHEPSDRRSWEALRAFLRELFGA